jgi:hypothetical protein
MHYTVGNEQVEAKEMKVHKHRMRLRKRPHLSDKYYTWQCKCGAKRTRSKEHFRFLLTR